MQKDIAMLPYCFHRDCPWKRQAMRLRKSHSVQIVAGAPGTIRTSDPQIRSLMLYPAELRARVSLVISGQKARRCFREHPETGRERAHLLPALARIGKVRCVRKATPNRALPLQVLGRPQARARSLRTESSSTGRSGMTIRNVAPIVPSTSEMVPPWARMSSAAIASPSPLPPGRPEVWNASKR